MIAFSIMVYTNNSSIAIFRHWGVGLGLSLTLWIYTTIALQYCNEGVFYPDLKTNFWIIAAFVMWVSNIKLEIWTLDPIRKKDEQTPEEFLQAQRTFKIHLTIHALLILTMHTLFVLK
jgi:hypothetical protein